MNIDTYLPRLTHVPGESDKILGGLLHLNTQDNVQPGSKPSTPPFHPPTRSRRVTISPNASLSS